jgi:p-aminobenzoyl-glutamate transporter AbgT
MHLELFLVRVLNTCASVFGVLCVFLQVLQQFSSDRSMLEMLPLAAFLYGAVYLFSPLSEGARVPTL